MPPPEVRAVAKPDLEDGYFKFAYELLPALLLGQFRKEASIVLCEVLAQTYGRGKRRSAVVEPARIAARCGCRRENVWRGLKQLTDANVLVRQDDGTYRFVKDYAKWRTDRGILMDTVGQAYCAAYPVLAKSYEPDRGGDPAVSTVDTASTNADDSTVSTVDTVSVSTVDTVSVSTVDTVSDSPLCTPLVGVRIGELEKGVVVDAGEDGRIAEIELIRPFMPDRDEVMRVCTWAEGLAGANEQIPSKVKQHATSYPLPWIEDAVLCGLAAQPGKVWAYAHRCLLRWWAAKGQDHDEVDRARSRVESPPAVRIHKPPSVAHREAQDAEWQRLIDEQAKREAEHGVG
jgi:hypothetical protein